MDKIELGAVKRDVRGHKVSDLRAAGMVPAVIYGRGVRQTELLELDARTLERVYRLAGGNKIVSLKIGDRQPRNVLIHEIQRGAIKGELKHVDFYAVRMDEVLKAEVPIRFVGESTAVYQGEGTLIKNIEAIGVECLPADLPDNIEVDISVLDDFDKAITLADLSLPAEVKLLEEDLTAVVAKVEPPRTDEEIAELEEEPGEAVPEGADDEAPVVVAEENDGNADRR
jgi:large subunit ribosomal protein L25